MLKLDKNKDKEEKPEERKAQIVGQYSLGAVLGKGGFGTVYQALDTESGGFVAVKQINLQKIPKDQLQSIMSEIDLMKNLNHPNIVKYITYLKTKDSLYIVMECMENGSLQSIMKKFGTFSEPLVANYIRQVLEGLVYLHEQGVVHRDIKGANILSSKNGHIKLADFGIATKFGDDAASQVVGTPYWMAPEIIELNGATTKSDIWSVGCTAIELLTGQPPYFELGQMPAMFRIVQDDCPPFPETVSPAFRDWLMQCFQKDPNLRVSAHKLVKHRWIQQQGARKKHVTAPSDQLVVSGSVAMSDEIASPKPAHADKQRSTNMSNSASYNKPGRKVQLPAFEEGEENDWGGDFAVKTLHLNVKSGGASSKGDAKDKPKKSVSLAIEPEHAPKLKKSLPAADSSDDMDWGDDFADTPTSLKLNAAGSIPKPKDKDKDKGKPKPKLSFVEDNDTAVVAADGDGDDLGFDLGDVDVSNLRMNTGDHTGHFKSNTLGALLAATTTATATAPKTTASAAGAGAGAASAAGGADGASAGGGGAAPGAGGLNRWEENDAEDWGDFSKVDSIANTMPANTGTMNSQIPGRPRALTLRKTKPEFVTSLDADDEDDDPFGVLEDEEEEFDSEQAQLKDNYARWAEDIVKLMSLLEPGQEERIILNTCEQLITSFKESPERKRQLVRQKGVLPVMDMLEVENSQVICSILKVVNQVIEGSDEIQENLCLVGGIPAIMRFASREYAPSIRLEAASFISQMCSTSTLTLQMFIACRGLPVLVDLLGSPYNAEQKNLVWMAVDAICSVYELQSPVPKGDFSRLFAKAGLLKVMAVVMRHMLNDPEAEQRQYPDKIGSLFLVFSTANHALVRQAICSQDVLVVLLDILDKLPADLLVKLVKAIKTVAAVDHNLLAFLFRAGAIPALTKLLDRKTGPLVIEIQTNLMNTLYFLCHLDQERQLEAVRCGLIPHLIYHSTTFLKEFSLQIFCELALVRGARPELWRHNAVQLYLQIAVSEPAWQVEALAALQSWLGDELPQLEPLLLQQSSVDKLVLAFNNVEARQNLLAQQLVRIVNISSRLCEALGSSVGLVGKLLERLQNPKLSSEVLNELLKLLSALYEGHPNPKAMISRFNLYPIVKALTTHKFIIAAAMAHKLLSAFNANTVI